MKYHILELVCYYFLWNFMAEKFVGSNYECNTRCLNKNNSTHDKIFFAMCGITIIIHNKMYVKFAFFLSTWKKVWMPVVWNEYISQVLRISQSVLNRKTFFLISRKILSGCKMFLKSSGLTINMNNVVEKGFTIAYRIVNIKYMTYKKSIETGTAFASQNYFFFDGNISATAVCFKLIA